ncbi:MAG TPA: hypothetical protein VGG61_08655 [Gemmataceae bacterium]|jgi:hypothetical protein
MSKRKVFDVASKDCRKLATRGRPNQQRDLNRRGRLEQAFDQVSDEWANLPVPKQGA